MGAKKITAPMNACSSKSGPWRVHKPSATESLKADHTSNTITTRSNTLVMGLIRASVPISSGRSRCPATKGNTSIVDTLSMVCARSISTPCPRITKLTSSGVSTTPNRVDKVALSTAAATLPRASAVIATDDDTVDGNAAR